MPRLMRDILEAELREQADMTLVGVAETADGLADDVRATAPDFVLIGADHDDALVPLLDEARRMRVLEIEPHAAGGRLYELRPRRVDLGPMSATDVVAAIRDAALGPRATRDGS